MSFYDIDLKDQVAGRHELWEIEKVVNFPAILYRFEDLSTKLGRSGYGIDVGIKSLYLQFHYNLSDRQLEKRLRFDIAFRWFCGFTAFEETPDHSFFCRFRKLLGTKRTAKFFELLVKRSKELGIMRSVFRFADATAVITKQTTWEERDKALAEGEIALNNKNINRYSADSQARFGCKGKDKFWFGYKAHVVPREGQMIFGDKAYSLSSAA